MDIVSILIGLVLGATGAWLWLRGKSGEEIAVLNEKVRALQAASEQDRVASDEKLALLEKAKETLGKEFENVANRIFDEKNTKSKANLNDILKPFKDQLGDFKEKVDTVYVEEGKQRQSLLIEIKHLKELNNQISKEAVDLTNALKGESKTRGNWGELVIDKVLESSGLNKPREYETQMYLKEKHGGIQGRYPDFVVHLPEGCDVVIDAKVALVDYDAYCTAEDDVERADALKRHVDAVRKHMTDLSSKDYQDLEGINSLEQVIMCVPNEPAYITAVAEDATLHDDAMKKGILIVGPNTLVLTLKIVAAMWRTEDQSRNALEIADRGQKMYEKFVGFVEDVQAIEKAVNSAAKACGDAKGKLSDGAGNLVGQAQKLVDLGVKAKKKLPQDIVDKSLTSGE